MKKEILAAFAQQAEACRSLGSDFTGALMETLARDLSAAPRLLALFEAEEGDLGPRGRSLPLRLAGGLHYLVRGGRAPELARAYPPASAHDVAQALAETLAAHQDWLVDWMRRAPQTNETGRSAVLIAVAHGLAARYGLPLTLSELGASAGLNLNFDAYALAIGDQRFGARDPVLTLFPEWSGPCPELAAFTVHDRRGVDLSPVSPQQDGARLLAYIWPDQTDRLLRAEAAIHHAVAHPVSVDCGDAAEWIEARLHQPMPGLCHLVYHTVAHQYFPAETQSRIAAAMERAGAQATEDCPLAWFGMEADDHPHGAALTLRLWPGDLRFDLGRAGFHGQWVEWRGF